MGYRYHTMLLRRYSVMFLVLSLIAPSHPGTIGVIQKLKQIFQPRSKFPVEKIIDFKLSECTNQSLKDAESRVNQYSLFLTTADVTNCTETNLPTVVASWNKENHGTASFAKKTVYLGYQLETFEQITTSRIYEQPVPFEVAESVAKSTNTVFNGTVTHLVLYGAENLNDSISGRVKMQLTVAKHFSERDIFKLGMLVDFDLCKVTDPTFVKPSLSAIIDQISLVMFKEDISINSFKVTRKFEACKEKLGRIYPQIQVAFYIVSSNKEVDSLQDVNLAKFNERLRRKQLLTVWKIKDLVEPSLPALPQMPMLPQSPKFPDQNQKLHPVEGGFSGFPTSPNIAPTRNGDSVSVSESSQVAPNNSTEMTYNITGKTVIYDWKNGSKAGVAFDKEYFGVVFQPAVLSHRGNDLHEQDLLPLLQIIHSKFSNILMSPIDSSKYSEEDASFHVPRVVASINKLQTKESCPDTKYKGAPPLRVYISVAFNFRHGFQDHNLAAFEDALILAEKSNAIFPGTVPSVVLFANFTNDRDLFGNEVELQINGFRSQLAQHDKNLIQLGLMMPLHACLELERDSAFSSIQFALFSVSFYTKEAEDSVHARILQMHNCKDKFEKKFPDISAGFVVEVIDTVKNDETTGRLVWLWKKVNAYAITYQTQIFMAEAFDNLAREISNGWWDIVKSVGYDSVETLQIREKYQHLPEYQPWLSKQHDKGYSATVIIIVVVSCLVLLSAQASLALFLWKRNRQLKKSGLSESEIEEFFEGKQDNGKDTVEYGNILANFDRKSYDTGLEISKESFTFDESDCLGSGAYGKVCLARVLKDGKEQTVALKIVHSSSTDTVVSLRSLLSEIKVLSYLGKNEHIIFLLGACTSEIKDGKAYAFLEICSLGSLEKYLRSFNRKNGATQDSVYMELNDHTKIGPQESLTKMMLRWSFEIAYGLEYLTSKNVVHMDLASRNVLLDKTQTAKICDFGLSRRLANYYQSYVKSQSEPLPWRWMAPESLKRMEFNPQTDIWSFGVTLWEIFTLGDVPYAGLSWSADFANQIENGLLLPVPDFNHPYKQTMYHIMLNCWQVEPTKRVSTASIKSRIATFLDTV